jgi:hypothetical protein
MKIVITIDENGKLASVITEAEGIEVLVRNYREEAVIGIDGYYTVDCDGDALFEYEAHPWVKPEAVKQFWEGYLL